MANSYQSVSAHDDLTPRISVISLPPDSVNSEDLGLNVLVNIVLINQVILRRAAISSNRLVGSL